MEAIVVGTLLAVLAITGLVVLWQAPDPFDRAMVEGLAGTQAAKLGALLARLKAKGAVHGAGRGELEPASGDACLDLGAETRRNAALVSCLQRDRRVEVSAAPV